MIEIPISAVVPFVVMTTCAVVSGLLLYMMVGRVNQRLPAAQQIPYVFMYPGKVSRVKREYRSLYPASRLIAVRLILNAGMFAAAVILAWRLGFFR